MSSTRKSLSDPGPSPIPNAQKFRFGLVVSQWHDDITGPLSKGAVDTLLEYGAREDSIYRIDVPGTFELPMGARMLNSRTKLDAIICIGCVIKGETAHNEYINQAVANGLVQFGLMSGIPCVFGVLTPNSLEQAQDRAGGKHGNKGIEAAVTAIQMAHLKHGSRDAGASIGFGQTSGG
ncbi:MAG: 6,7-dimethyl-8-ribityllumazine synthase [Saprospiraceae bacterium]|nr:6,7-dimethyl-8-ribityllumazine synthase [Saprospiraceae bacterium]